MSAVAVRRPRGVEPDPLAPLRSGRGISLIAATVLASGVASYVAYVVNVAVSAIALVPVLLNVGAGGSLSQSLVHGYRPAMLMIGGLRVGAAVVTWLFVSDEPAAAPAIAAPDRGCALPVREAAAA